jgi:hydrogenase nickel incorporation protein HypB
MAERTLEVNTDALRRKRAAAESFRRRMETEGTLVVQLLSSPGAGKTTLLEATARRLSGAARMAMLVGDLATERDADRLRRRAPAVQITTGGACHLDIALVEEGWERLPRGPFDFLFIEDVGNLVCPASHDVGQHVRAVLLSTPEGDDKAAKYPKAFRTSQALVITKTDLSPHVPFCVEAALEDARRVQGALETFALSALTGEGMEAWTEYLQRERRRRFAPGGRSGDGE